MGSFDIRPRRAVFVDGAQQQDAILVVIPFAEKIQTSLHDSVKRKILHFKIGVNDAASVKIIQAESSGSPSAELQSGNVDNVENIA